MFVKNRFCLLNFWSTFNDNIKKNKFLVKLLSGLLGPCPLLVNPNVSTADVAFIFIGSCVLLLRRRTMHHSKASYLCTLLGVGCYLIGWEVAQSCCSPVLIKELNVSEVMVWEPLSTWFQALFSLKITSFLFRLLLWLYISIASRCSQVW